MLEQPTTITTAWNDYRLAFRQFAKCIQNVQMLAQHSNRDAALIDEIVLEAEKAHAHYIECRNALARELLEASGRRVWRELLPDSSQMTPYRTKRVAELLWEAAGKPNGTADTDWYRAEQIVRRAATL